MTQNKPFIAKTWEGHNLQSASPAAMCAAVQMAEQGEVAAWPGYESVLEEEIARRKQAFPGTWKRVAPGRWKFEAQ